MDDLAHAVPYINVTVSGERFSQRTGEESHARSFLHPRRQDAIYQVTPTERYRRHRLLRNEHSGLKRLRPTGRGTHKYFGFRASTWVSFCAPIKPLCSDLLPLFSLSPTNRFVPCGSLHERSVGTAHSQDGTSLWRAKIIEKDMFVILRDLVRETSSGGMLVVAEMTNR